MTNIKTITITDVTQPQINAAFIALTSATKGLEVDIRAVDSAWKAANKDLQQQIESIRRGTLVYTAGDHVNISSTGVISVTDVNKTLTIRRNGTDLATFTALAVADKVVDITVPTKTSDIQNDSGYITSADIPTNISSFTNDVGYLTDDTVPQDIYYCTTTYITAAKVATSNYGTTDFTLVDGRKYLVYIQNGNGGGSATARTMNINGTGALPLYVGDHVLAITGDFQMDGGLYNLIYHAATSSVEAYFRVLPIPSTTVMGFTHGGSGITINNTQNSFNKNFTFELLCQSSTNNSVTLYDWYGNTATATCIVDGCETIGIPSNGYHGLAFFYYDAANGHKLYIASDFQNIFGLAVGAQTNTTTHFGTIPIQLRNVLKAWGAQYNTDSLQRYAVDLNNSDVIGLNGLYTRDSAGGYSEGLNFYRRSHTVDSVTHYYYDALYAVDGHFYFGADVERRDTKASETTGIQNSNAILHAANYIGKTQYAQNYTYVIDSDSSLSAWMNNTAGNDYTSVLIKKGSYTTNRNAVCNLATLGTKVVHGEPGASITIYMTAYVDCFSIGSGNPESFDTEISGFTLNVSRTGLGSGSTRLAVFYYIPNIHDMVINITQTASVSASYYACGFHTCSYVNNCRLNYDFSGTTYARVLGFYNCHNVTNVRMITGTRSSSTTSTFRCFDTCKDVSYSYVNCGSSNSSVAFYSCTRLSHNTAENVTTKYYTSYASSTADATYACADTANGGFNA